MSKWTLCLSPEQIQEAWDMQYNGKSSSAVARTMNCSVMTLYRGYKACGLPPPFAQRYSDDDAEEENHK